MEYDVLIYDRDTLIFRGSFCNGGEKSLTLRERQIRRAMETGIESLNEEKSK